MKSILACTGLILSVCALSFAQDNGNRIVVPARDASHPRKLVCSLTNGSITVKTSSGTDVIVADASAHAEDRRSPDGMRRIGMSARGLEVVAEDNVITVSKVGGNAELVITVPVETSLRLHTLSGAINADGVHGEVDVHTLNGHVTLTNISGTISADSQNGPIKVTMNRVDPGKPLAFSTFNGLVDLTLPQNLKADLTVKSNHGAVYSDFDVTLGGTRTATEKNSSADGKYRIRIDSTIRGSIGGGGVDLTIRTFNGPVYIRKQK